MPYPKDEVHTVSTTPCTLQWDGELRLNGTACGTWWSCLDNMYYIEFRGSGQSHSFMYMLAPCVATGCLKLLPASSSSYADFATPVHTKIATDIVLMLGPGEQ